MSRAEQIHFVGWSVRRTASVVALLAFTAGCQGGNQHGRLESYRALAARQKVAESKASEHHNDSTHPGNAQLFASSLLLSREDLLPCESLPPRRLTQSDGVVAWVDGSWSSMARPFVVKGSAQSGLCRLEIRPKGSVVLNPGQKDAFVRGSQIRVLLATPSGEALIPPANQGVVHCAEREGAFEVSFEGFNLGRSSVGYVMNEALPLELGSRVCLARLLNDERKALNEWVFIIPTQNLSTSSINAPESLR
ncbi:MAG: hypothetical protein RI932_171 [Pseudomonadota bacterium]